MLRIFDFFFFFFTNYQCWMMDLWYTSGAVLSTDGMMIGRVKPKYSLKNLPHCHFVCNKSHVNYLVIQARPSR